MWSVEGALPQWARRDSTLNDNSVLEVAGRGLTLSIPQRPANTSPGPLLIVASRLLRRLFSRLLRRLFSRIFSHLYDRV